MLFDITLRRDLARNFFATAVVILTVVLTIMLIRGLGEPFDVHEIDRNAMMRSIEVLARAQDAARAASAARRAS